MTGLASSRPGQPSQRRGRVRLRTLILIRWIAVAGQARVFKFLSTFFRSSLAGLGTRQPIAAAGAGVTEQKYES